MSQLERITSRINAITPGDAEHNYDKNDLENVLAIICVAEELEGWPRVHGIAYITENEARQQGIEFNLNIPFTRGDLGPFSYQLKDILQTLRGMKLIDTDKFFTKYYKITELGKQYFEQEIESDTKRAGYLAIMKQVVAQYKDMETDVLVDTITKLYNVYDYSLSETMIHPETRFEYAPQERIKKYADFAKDFFVKIFDRDDYDCMIVTDESRLNHFGELEDEFEDDELYTDKYFLKVNESIVEKVQQEYGIDISPVVNAPLPDVFNYMTAMRH